MLPITDHRGSVVGAVESDASGTTLLAGADYTPMGRVASLDPTDDDAETCREEGNPGTRCAHPVGMPFGFAGACRSDATGLVYMRFRWYSPALAQFLTPDPMGEVDSWNLYAYVGGDPINRWDPWGLESTQTAKEPRCGQACQVAPAGGGVLIRWNRTFGRIRAGWGKPGRRGSASSDRTPEQEAAENRLEEETQEQARRNEYRIRETENREPRVGARVRRNLGREGESEYPPTTQGPQISRPWVDVEIERAREEVAREAPPGPPAPGAAPPASQAFVDQMSQEEAARYERYWRQDYKNVYKGAPNTRQRQQAPPGTRSITDQKPSGTGELYPRETIYDEDGRKIGNNDYSDHGRPLEHGGISHHHSNPPTQPDMHGPVSPGPHPDTPR